MNNKQVHFSSENAEWETPQDFFDKLNDEFHFVLDDEALVRFQRGQCLLPLALAEIAARQRVPRLYATSNVRNCLGHLNRLFQMSDGCFQPSEALLNGPLPGQSPNVQQAIT